MKLLACALAAYIPISVLAQTVKVGFEPFPPIINEDGSGIAVELLKAVSERSDLTFTIEMMSYSRAKKSLSANELNLIGLTPKGHETEAFYHYADELTWSFNTTVDIYATEATFLSIENIEDGSIGTLAGNADFLSATTKIAREKFIEVSSLEQLVKMLLKGRIQRALFERVTMMMTIQRIGLPNIHYRKVMELPASFAVAKSPAGKALKEQLDDVLKNLNTKAYLDDYLQFNLLSNSGVVSTFSDKKKR